LFSRVLSDVEVRHLFRNREPLSWNSIDSYVSTTFAPLGRDTGGRGKNWTVTGSPTVVATQPPIMSAPPSMLFDLAAASASQAPATPGGFDPPVPGRSRVYVPVSLGEALPSITTPAAVSFAPDAPTARSPRAIAQALQFDSLPTIPLALKWFDSFAATQPQKPTTKSTTDAPLPSVPLATRWQDDVPAARPQRVQPLLHPQQAFPYSLPAITWFDAAPPAQPQKLRPPALPQDVYPFSMPGVAWFDADPAKKPIRLGPPANWTDVFPTPAITLATAWFDAPPARPPQRLGPPARSQDVHPPVVLAIAWETDWTAPRPWQHPALPQPPHDPLPVAPLAIDWYDAPAAFAPRPSPRAILNDVLGPPGAPPVGWIDAPGVPPQRPHPAPLAAPELLPAPPLQVTWGWLFDSPPPIRSTRADNSPRFDGWSSVVRSWWTDAPAAQPTRSPRPAPPPQEVYGTSAAITLTAWADMAQTTSRLVFRPPPPTEPFPTVIAQTVTAWIAEAQVPPSRRQPDRTQPQPQPQPIVFTAPLVGAGFDAASTTPRTRVQYVPPPVDVPVSLLLLSASGWDTAPSMQARQARPSTWRDDVLSPLLLGYGGWESALSPRARQTRQLPTRDEVIAVATGGAGFDVGWLEARPPRRFVSGAAASSFPSLAVLTIYPYAPEADAPMPRRLVHVRWLDAWQEPIGPFIGVFPTHSLRTRLIALSRPQSVLVAAARPRTKLS
jgi:hypothetical protein